MNSSVRSRAEARYLLPLLRVARVVDGQLLEIRSRERLRGHLRFNSCTEGGA